MTNRTMRLRPIIFFTAVGLALSACASRGNFGQQVRTEGAATMLIGDSWEKGRKNEQKGEKLVKEGEDLVRRGEKNVRQGENMIAEGTALAQGQKAAYVKGAATIGNAVEPMGVRDEIKVLRGIADKWENALERVAQGEKKIRTGEKQVADGTKSQREGDTLASLGRDQMRKSERDYQRSASPAILEPGPAQIRQPD